MLAIKPHKVTVQLTDQTADPTTTIVWNPAKIGSPVTVIGYFEQMKPSEAFLQFGVDVKAGARFMIEPTDAAKFAPQAIVTFNGQEWVEVGIPEVHQAGDPTDHALIYLRLERISL